MASDKPLVFVSCGQYDHTEKQLGKDICSVLAALRPDVEAYFAQDQSTVEGLSRHILKALHRAAGFICVMHRRGDLMTPGGRKVTRGSVWIEQEIAIAAFMNHVLDRSIPILFYQQVGVGLEGIRSALLMNPHAEFTEEAQVLDHLRSVLPSMVFSPFNSYDLVPLLSFRKISGRSDGDRHVYVLTANVKNVGNERITDFEIRVLFPRAFLSPSAGSEDRSKSTRSHACFTANAEGRAPGGLYRGDTVRNPLTVEYFVDNALDDDPEAMQSEIKVELFSGSMTPKSETRLIRDFLDF